VLLRRVAEVLAVTHARGIIHSCRMISSPPSAPRSTVGTAPGAGATRLSRALEGVGNESQGPKVPPSTASHGAAFQRNAERPLAKSLET
jgi:hypothetical protein